MWNKPWSFREGAVIGLGLLITGQFLQLTIGEVAWNLFAYPLNILLAIFFLILIAIAYLFHNKVYALRWCMTSKAAIPIIGWCALLIFVLGLTSWMDMLRWWPLVLCFTYMLFILGMASLHRLFRFRWKEIPFLLNHLGLFIALLAGTLGNADMQRLRMEVEVGKPEWRAIDENTHGVKELDLAIELHSFSIDEYPAKLMLVENNTGRTAPTGNPDQIILEDSTATGSLLDWDIQVDQYLELAAQVVSDDTVKFVEWKNMGATTAARITATQRQTGVKKEGWASCGSFMFPYYALKLNDQYSLIMPDREPKRFASDVTVYTKSGKKANAVIEVNKPLELEGWKIYQLSYDESMGRWSNLSVFELVSDPWLPLVYTGIFMMLAGAAWMFATAGIRRKEGKS
ncbi:MAG: cytochrome c biogenesis protein ResB [Bacteroidaceae bacterium]|nr:cytochrome c biogenesis protein ResB [Bacteroidaceae bacterium]